MLLLFYRCSNPLTNPHSKKEHPGLGMLLFVSLLFSPGCYDRIPLRALTYASSATFSFWVASISMISSTRLW